MLTIHLKLSFFFLMDGLVNQKIFFSVIIKSLGLFPIAKEKEKNKLNLQKKFLLQIKGEMLHIWA